MISHSNLVKMLIIKKDENSGRPKAKVNLATTLALNRDSLFCLATHLISIEDEHAVWPRSNYFTLFVMSYMVNWLVLIRLTDFFSNGEAMWYGWLLGCFGCSTKSKWVACLGYCTVAWYSHTCFHRLHLNYALQGSHLSSVCAHLTFWPNWLVSKHYTTLKTWQANFYFYHLRVDWPIKVFS